LLPHAGVTQASAGRYFLDPCEVEISVEKLVVPVNFTQVLKKMQVYDGFPKASRKFQ